MSICRECGRPCYLNGAGVWTHDELPYPWARHLAVPASEDRPLTWAALQYRLTHCSDCGCAHRALARDGCTCVCHGAA